MATLMVASFAVTSGSLRVGMDCERALKLRQVLSYNV